MAIHLYTQTEVEAYSIARDHLGWGHSTDDRRNPHDAGNWIIMLAAKINAERSSAILDYAVRASEK